MTDNEKMLAELVKKQPWDLGIGGIDEGVLDGFFSILSLAVNSFCFHPEEILDSVLPDPRGRMFLTIFSMEWIRCWGEKDASCFDARNELAGRMCRIALSCPSYRELCRFRIVEGGNYEKAARYLAKKSLTMHRTLMQTLTGLVLHTLKSVDCCFVQSLCMEITERMAFSTWEHLPLI